MTIDRKVLDIKKVKKGKKINPAPVGDLSPKRSSSSVSALEQSRLGEEDKSICLAVISRVLSP